MTGEVSSPPQIDPVLPELLSAPLDFLIAEHRRQRQLFGCLERLAAAGTLERSLAAEALAYLRRDMVLHVLDEEQDLFPLMRRRCAPEDDIEAVLAILAGDCARHRRLAVRLVRGLETALADGRPPQAYRGLGRALRTFANGERCHLALENAVVLPLARRRLKAADLDLLAAALAARRAAESPVGARGRGPADAAST